MARRGTYWTNRTMCDVLSEMRQANDSRNYSYIGGLIEEAQSLANRMEAGLEDKKDLVKMSEERHQLKREVMELRREVDELREAAGKPPVEDDGLGIAV